MLTAAAVLLIAVSAMHSVLGGIRLINPICGLANLPIILGSRRNTVLALQIGWHFLSLSWVALACLLFGSPSDPTAFAKMFFYGGSALFAACGMIALVASRGRHLAWVFFFPIAGLLYITAERME